MQGFTGLSRETFGHRVAAVRHYLLENGLDGLFAFSDEYRPGSTLYLADYYPINVIEESPQGVYVASEGEVTLFLGAINTRTAVAITWIEDIRSIETLDAFFNRLREQEGRQLNLALVGEALLPVKYYRRMRAALEGSEFVYADDLLNRMRAIKSPEEVALMEHAAHLGDTGLMAAVERLKAGGASENDLAAAAEHAVRLGGANLVSATIVSAGQHTRLPTWRPSDYKIAPGDAGGRSWRRHQCRRMAEFGCRLRFPFGTRHDPGDQIRPARLRVGWNPSRIGCSDGRRPVPSIKPDT